ncbi:MAG: alpha/beta hydrolase fold domain-containing protein [Planctomycetota bacterium]|jgi:hypothetical protein
MRSTLLLILALVLPAAATAEDRSETFIQKHDADMDGRLSREEFPTWARRLFSLVDKDGDGYVTLAEDRAFRKAREGRGQRRPRRSKLLAPTHADVAYGPHERNRIDLWIASGEGPRPFVIYYHGGGFRGGDKRTLNPLLLKDLLELGVTVAAVNYRLSGTAPFPAQMHDCARALQCLRHHAEKFGLDPKKVGATGGSAGAGISQWLAFHDDLADPESEDPVARESTRIACAVVYAAQTTYDPRRLREIFQTEHVDSALIPFFGMKSAEDVDDGRFHPLFEEASPLHHLTKDDPPVLLYYPQPNRPLPPNPPGKLYIHHPKFGEILKEKMDGLGVECVVKFRENYAARDSRQAPLEDYLKFFAKHLLGFGR